MTDMATETRVFEFIPLSPVHIGSGERMQPEEYFYTGGQLERIDLGRLVGCLNEKTRTHLEGLIDSNKLSELRSFLKNIHEKANRKFVQYRIRVGESSRRELEKLAENPQRSGEVHLLPRNPYTRDVLIPGSAIKGALRTAWLNYCLHQPENAQRIAELKRRGVETRAEELVNVAFNINPQNTEKDPLRLLRVCDGKWSKDEVQIDRVTLRKLGRDERQTAGIQAYYERLLSKADGENVKRKTLISISIEEPANRRRMELIKKPIDWPNLIFAAYQFYAERIQQEIERFKFPQKSHRLWFPDQTFRVEEDMLIRVGRFCHFESSSVNDLRQSMNRQTKEPITISSTRTLCPVAENQRAPFGWVHLKRVG